MQYLITKPNLKDSIESFKILEHSIKSKYLIGN